MAQISSIALLEYWVRQAVANYGDDWTKIALDVAEKCAHLDPGQKDQLRNELMLVLAGSGGSEYTN